MHQPAWNGRYNSFCRCCAHIDILAADPAGNHVHPIKDGTVPQDGAAIGQRAQDGEVCAGAAAEMETGIRCNIAGLNLAVWRRLNWLWWNRLWWYGLRWLRCVWNRRGDDGGISRLNVKAPPVIGG